MQGRVGEWEEDVNDKVETNFVRKIDKRKEMKVGGGYYWLRIGEKETYVHVCRFFGGEL